MIEANGSTQLTEVGDHFFLYDGSGSGPSLKYGGTDYVAGQFGAWTPIGAEQTATGYEVAWKVTGADQYTVWNTDSSGNYITNVVGAVSGTSSALESFEPSFHQDLNGDGQIGPRYATTVIEANGSTQLTEVGDHFFLYDGSGSGPSLKYGGADAVAGQFGAWTPIGAEQTATGYEVAWKITGADQYTVWNTDSSGNYITNVVGAVSGTSSALESFEPGFHQDLNRRRADRYGQPGHHRSHRCHNGSHRHSVRHCDRFRQRLGQRRRCRRAVLPGWRPARHRGHHRSLQRELEHDHGDERQPHAAGSCPRCGRQHHQFGPAHGHGFQHGHHRSHRCHNGSHRHSVRHCDRFRQRLGQRRRCRRAVPTWMAPCSAPRTPPLPTA